ncbi:MAG: hypothetical protein K0S65_3388 [Labilithrix sp.]|nr:hypothetical protein [Labilithrix sp.]
MDVLTELEQDQGIGDGLDPTEPAEAGPSPSPSPADVPAPVAPVPARKHALEEASFLVVESGRIRFFVRPRVEVETPRSLEDVQRFSFTLAPRNRGEVRRVSVGKKRLPDTRVHERRWAYVDRVGSAAHVVSDLGPRRYTTKSRGVRNQAGVIEIARGTYAITSHRDHAHLMYELDADSSGYVTLLRQLCIVPRASYIAAVFNPEAKWRVRDREEPDVPFSEPVDDGLMDKHDKRRFTPLDPVFLDHEGTELVLIGGGLESETTATWAGS